MSRQNISMTPVERNVKECLRKFAPRTGRKNVACLKKRIGRSCSANAAAMTETKREIKKHITLIARKSKTLSIMLAAVFLSAAFTTGCTYTGAEFKKGVHSMEYETTEAQEDEGTEKLVSSEDILKKLDEIIGNPHLSGDELKSEGDLLGMETVTVETVEEFLDSIGPHKVIKLSPGTYRLDELPSGYKGNEYVRIQEERQGNRFGGKEIVIRDVENLWIEGLGNERVNVVTADQEANVLTFENASYVFIDNLCLGHLPKKGGCYGGVAVFINSAKIRIENTELFGCGINGLELCNTEDVLFTRSVITDCSSGILFLSNSSRVCFEYSSFKENRGTAFVNINNCSDVIFRGCSFENNTAVTDIAALFVIDCAYSPYVYYSEPKDLVSDVLVADTRFANNEITSNRFARFSDNSGNSIKLENNTFEGSGPYPDASS